MTDPLLDEFADVVEVLEALTPAAPRAGLEDDVKHALEQLGPQAAETTDQAPAPAVRVVLSCTFCHDRLARERAYYCASCLAPHHAECFAEHGRCAIQGCEERELVQPRASAPPRPPRGWRLRAAVACLAGAGTLAAVVAAKYVRMVQAELELQAASVRESLAASPPPSAAADREARIEALLTRLLDEVDTGQRAALCQELAQLDPDGRSGSFARALLALGQDRSDDAIADLNRAIELDPGWSVNYAARGQVRIGQGQLRAALADLDRALQLDPRHPWTWFWRGYVQRKLSDVQSARADFDRALELAPDHGDALFMRATLAFDEARYAEAIDDLRRVQELARAGETFTLGQVAYVLARCFDAQGARAEAIDAYERYLDQAAPGERAYLTARERVEALRATEVDAEGEHEPVIEAGAMDRVVVTRRDGVVLTGTLRVRDGNRIVLGDLPGGAPNDIVVIPLEQVRSVIRVDGDRDQD